MTKYLSKEGLNLYDGLIKDYFDDKVQNVLDLVAYGVEWDINVADPHLTRIGNLSFHRTLPIQSGMKPCIAQSDKIMYWLNETDKRFRKDTTGYIVTLPLTIDSGVYKLVDQNNFTNKRYYKQYVKVNNLIAQVKDIDTTTYTATLNFIDNPDTLEAGDCTVEFGAVLNGYDGTVEVFVPAFYIKSFIEGTKRRVYISTIKIDDTWYYQKKCLLGAFRCTVLNTVPEDMGYLSTLPVNSAISVVNTESYCRGGGNRTAFDQYLETDPFRTDLGKSRSSISRSTMRTYARNAGKEILNYIQYKNICYWLYVIEYANFNCQENFNTELTELGYKQGGLGSGVTNLKYINIYNNNYSVIPAGYTLDISDSTNIKTAKIITPKENGGEPIVIQYTKVPMWRYIENLFGDIGIILDGIIIQGTKTDIMSVVYITNNPDYYGDSEEAKSKMWIAGYITNSGGFIKEFDLGNEANIIPNLTGGSATTYKCDYNIHVSNLSQMRVMIIASDPGYSQTAGICFINSSGFLYTSNTTMSFRLIKEID